MTLSVIWVSGVSTTSAVLTLKSGHEHFHATLFTFKFDYAQARFLSKTGNIFISQPNTAEMPVSSPKTGPTPWAALARMLVSNVVKILL